MLGVQFLPTLFDDDQPMDAAVAHDPAVSPANKRLAIQTFELERLLERQTDQDPPPTRIDEISPRRVVPRLNHDAPSLARSRSRSVHEDDDHKPK